MGYVVYEKSTRRVTGKVYKTHAAAQAQLTRMGKASGLWLTDSQHPLYLHGIAEEEYFAKHIRRTVTRVNLMTGKEYEEAEDTPLACSPASETYWSM